MKISFPKSYVAFDTETTGLDTATADIVEIGAKRVIRDLEGNVTEEETRSWLLDLGIELPEITTEITGITTAEMKEKGMDPREGLLEFLEFSRGLPWIGHNLFKFDIPLIINFGARHSIHEVAFKGGIGRAVDTAGLYKGRALGEDHRHHETHEDYVRRVLETRVRGLKFNLAHCCEELKIDASAFKAHRAEGDVEMVDAIYRKMVGLS